MIFLKLLSFQWKMAKRSPMWQKNLILNLVIGFFLFLTGAYLLLLGIVMRELLIQQFPGSNPLHLFNGALLYYFMADLLMRFLMQSLPRLTLESFLHLPIRKPTLIHYMVGRSVFDVFNLLPLLVVLPVTFTLVMPQAGNHACFWLTAVLLLILANNFLITYLKRLLGTQPLITVAVGIVFVMLILLDRLDILSLTDFSLKGFNAFIYHPLLLLLPVAWAVFTYLLHYRFLKFHLYPDEVRVIRKQEFQTGTSSQYLRSLGLTGTIIALEVKLYWRNKRTRTILYMLPVFLLYGLIFYPQSHNAQSIGILMFVGVFITGGMMLNYANYAFGYESGYFDTLLTKNIDFQQYIRVKFYIAFLISTICFVLTIPYIYYGYKILLINTAMYFYNIGVLAFVLLYFATFNKKRMDLTRGGAFNYQGIGAMNWLAVIPAFLLPFLLTIPFSKAGYPYTGIAFTGCLGVVGLLFSKSLIRLISRNFEKRKYIMADCFRQKD